MQTNQVIVEFNTNQLKKNKELLQKKLNISSISSENINELVKKNKLSIQNFINLKLNLDVDKRFSYPKLVSRSK